MVPTHVQTLEVFALHEPSRRIGARVCAKRQASRGQIRVLRLVLRTQSRSGRERFMAAMHGRKAGEAAYEPSAGERGSATRSSLERTDMLRLAETQSSAR